MLLLTYLEKLFVAWVVRRRLSDIGRGTVDPEVWTWQLIRELRWRFAGLMEDSPTLLGRIRLSPVGRSTFGDWRFS